MHDKASIGYFIEVRHGKHFVEVPFFMKNAGSVEEFQDNHKLQNAVYQLKSCCCLDKGKVVVAGKFQKQVYQPGEVVNLYASVDASESKWDVTKILVTASCRIKVSDNFRSDLFTRIVGQAEAPGMKAGEKNENIPIQFQLQAPMSMQTVYSELIRAEYFIGIRAVMESGSLDCDCDCSFCAMGGLGGRQAILPIMVKMMSTTQLASFQKPANWNPQKFSGVNGAVQMAPPGMQPGPNNQGNMMMPAMPNNQGVGMNKF
jgi:hypothetical protein